MVCALLPRTGYSKDMLQHKIMSAFVYNFTKYIDWPSASFPSRDSPLKVCVLGDDPVAALLQPLSKRTFGERPINVLRISEPLDASACNIIYMADDDSIDLREQLRYLVDVSALTISSTHGFIDQGGMIGFVVEDERIRLEINVDATYYANLRVSAKLLEVAIKVKGSRSRGQSDAD